MISYEFGLALAQRQSVDLAQLAQWLNGLESQFTMAPIFWERGEYGRAIEAGEASIEVGKQAGFMIPSVMSAYIPAWIYGDLGDIEQGMAWAAYSLAQARPSATPCAPDTIRRWRTCTCCKAI